VNGLEVICESSKVVARVVRTVFKAGLGRGIVHAVNGFVRGEGALFERGLGNRRIACCKSEGVASGGGQRVVGCFAFVMLCSIKRVQVALCLMSHGLAIVPWVKEK
jgi:hypothetical protein